MSLAHVTTHVIIFLSALYVIRHTATLCNTLQHTATHCTYSTHCNTLHLLEPLQHTALLRHLNRHSRSVKERGLSEWVYATDCNILQQTATDCNTLQLTVTDCNRLQRTATHCNALQRAATHCNALQRTATHCNARQHTAIHSTTNLFSRMGWTCM